MAPSRDKFHVRLATVADVDALVHLLTILFTQEADFKPDAVLQRRALQTILSQPAIGQIYCAIVDNKIVGMVSLLFTISTAEGGRAAWLEDMVVTLEYRKLGIGQKLLQAAIQGARSAECSRITLLTDATNDRAQRFYQRSGFQPSQMRPLRLYLNPTSH